MEVLLVDVLELIFAQDGQSFKGVTLDSNLNIFMHQHPAITIRSCSIHLELHCVTNGRGLEVSVSFNLSIAVLFIAFVLRHLPLFFIAPSSTLY